jgi:hypothetical protein
MKRYLHSFDKCNKIHYYRLFNGIHTHDNMKFYGINQFQYIKESVEIDNKILAPSLLVYKNTVLCSKISQI